MAEIFVSLIQTKDVIYTARQGNAIVLELVWEQETELSTPPNPLYEIIDISDFSFFAQIRTDTVDKGGAVLHTFDETPDDDSNHYDIDINTATTTFYISDELTRSMKIANTYYFECKMRDAEDDNIESVVVQFKIAEEYAREVPVEP